jgi:hypothetical protein
MPTGSGCCEFSGLNETRDESSAHAVIQARVPYAFFAPDVGLKRNSTTIEVNVNRSLKRPHMPM